MSLWSKIKGTAETLFQIGLGGPQIKNETVNTVVGIANRNSTDTAYVPARALDPIGDQDLVTKHYEDTRFRRVFLLMGA